MVFDLLIVASVAGAIWWWQTRRPRQARHARGEVVSLMPYEDLPPIGAFAPLPDQAEFDDYIAEGLERIDGFLAGRDQTA